MTINRTPKKASFFASILIQLWHLNSGVKIVSISDYAECFFRRFTTNTTAKNTPATATTPIEIGRTFEESEEDEVGVDESGFGVDDI